MCRFHAISRRIFDQIRIWGRESSPRVQVHRLPGPPPRKINHQNVPTKLLQFFAPGTSIGSYCPPSQNAASDDRAMGILRDLCPNVSIEGVPCEKIAWGLGALHCASCHQVASPNPIDSDSPLKELHWLFASTSTNSTSYSPAPRRTRTSCWWAGMASANRKRSTASTAVAGIPVVAFFLGQMSDPGDLIGLMHKDDSTGRSAFLPPYWWPTERPANCSFSRRTQSSPTRDSCSRSWSWLSIKRWPEKNFPKAV